MEKYYIETTELACQIAMREILDYAKKKGTNDIISETAGDLDF